MIIQFSRTTIEALRYYVYALVDPRDNKIFYVGKGQEDRVFQHLECAINEDAISEKLDIIREIRSEGLHVKHFIVRHGLDEDDAFTVESILIDLLSYSSFSNIRSISNIVSGHHQWDKGIKTAEEIEGLYACEQLEVNDFIHNVLTININATYNIKNERHPNIYEATRKSWVLSEQKLNGIEYVLSEYRGVVRAIFKPTKWIKDGKRFIFEGFEVAENEITYRYLNKLVPKKQKGMANPVRYFNKINL
jgi:hypothetical protein